MLRRLIPAALLLAGACTAFSQNFGSVALQIMIVFEGERQPVDKEITVTLMDAWGSVEEVQTTKQGIVQFFTVPGIHRLRITGADIEQFYTEFQTDSGGFQGTQTIEVQRRRSKDQAGAEPTGPVPVIRLKIPGKARKEFRKGEEALERKDWAEARTRFEKAIALYADYDLAYCKLGMAYLNAGDKESARRNFEKAIRLNDSYAEAHRELARILLAEKKYAEADAALKKSLNTESANLWALSFASLAELLTGKFDEAIANARKVHALSDQGFASAHLIAARAFEAVRRPDEALAEYQLYLKEDPNGPNAHHARAAVERLSATVQK